MLSPLQELLRGYQVILASSSVPRRDVLNQIGLKFISIPSPFDEESVKPGLASNPQEYVKTLAYSKALAVVKNEKDASLNPKIVVGADTVIVDGAKIIGKPHTKEKAIETLTSLSGRNHAVCTGISIIVCDKNPANNIEDTFISVTEVEFGNLSKETIASYVETQEPLNKAGAYGIQGVGAVLVKGIKGDYYNVVGFPVFEFCNRLAALMRSKK